MKHRHCTSLLICMLCFSATAFADHPCGWDPCIEDTLESVAYCASWEDCYNDYIACVEGGESACTLCSCDNLECSGPMNNWGIDDFCPEISGYKRWVCGTGLCRIGGCSRHKYHCFYAKIDNEEDCDCEEGRIPGKQCADPNVGNPINLYSGNKKESATDLQFNTPFEQGFSLYRKYRSRSNIDSPIGFGWTHNYHVTLSVFGTEQMETYRIHDESGKDRIFQYNDIEVVFEGQLSSQGFLVKNANNSFTWHRQNGIKYTFDQDYRFIAKEDGQGNRQTLSYDAADRIESVTDQTTGRSIGFVYNADGQVAQITGPVTSAVPDGIWATYAYDAEGNLTRVEYADDGNGSDATGFIYKYEDANDPHNLTEKRNLADEFLASWEYDFNDRAWKNVNRDGTGITISYNRYYYDDFWGVYHGSIYVTDEQGGTKTYTIDIVDGRSTIANVSNPNGCSSCGDDAVRYEHDSDRRIIEKELANGRIDQYADFDSENRYTTEIQAVGTDTERTFTYTYHPDTGDRLNITESAILGTGDKETIFDYDDDGNDTPNENPTPRMYRKIERGFTYDENGATIPYEYITAYDYNSRGQATFIDGPLPGNQDVTAYSYDPVTADRLTETHPLVGTTLYEYDDAGNLTHVTDINGHVTTYAYDGRNRLLSTTRNGITISNTYTAAGELKTTTDALGRTKTHTYNTEGFLDRITDPNGNYRFFDYDEYGQQTEESVYQADDTRTWYAGVDYGDPANNPDLVSGKPWKNLYYNQAGDTLHETTYAYNTAGTLTSVLDANAKETTYTYDLFDRLEQVTQPGDVITAYAYDRHGNLASVTDAEGHVTTYTYDDMGRLVKTVSPDTGTTLNSYDANGNLRFQTQNGNTIEFQYDALNRLTQKCHLDPMQDVTMTYDTGFGTNLIGRLAKVTDIGGEKEYSYNAEGRVTSVTRTVSSFITGASQPFTTTYGYDDAGNIRSVTYPTGQVVTYHPHATDTARVGEVIWDNQTLAQNINYLPMGGPLTGMTLGNGIALNTTYDLNYQPIELAYSVFLDRTHGTDNVGNITEITDNLDPGRSQGFVYDDLYRLASADGEYGTMAYTYDGVGNRKTKTINGFQEQYNYFPGTNRLSGIFNKATYAYNDNGSVTEINQTDGGPTPPPVEDKTTLYHFDLAGRLIAETDQSGALIKAYVWLHNRPLAMIRNDNSICYYHNDHLGTPQRMTDDTGAIVWAADYKPFGRADITIELVENNLRFPGQYHDAETGLHYNWHRYYDPETGRYLRADPSHSYQHTEKIGISFSPFKSAFIPAEINPYNYGQGNPLIYIDPHGLKSIKDHYEDLKDVESVINDCKGLFKNGEFSCNCDQFDQCLKCTKTICERYGPVGSPGFGGCYPMLQKICSVCLEY